MAVAAGLGLVLIVAMGYQLDRGALRYAGTGLGAICSRSPCYARRSLKPGSA